MAPIHQCIPGLSALIQLYVILFNGVHGYQKLETNKLDAMRWCLCMVFSTANMNRTCLAPEARGFSQFNLINVVVKSFRNQL